VDHQTFYMQIFASIEAEVGPVDPISLVAIVGFDAGGPLTFRTFGAKTGDACVTYLSCELAVREDQRPSEFGRYELLATCDDEAWVRSVVSDIGRMTLEAAFGNGHTMDIGAWVEGDDSIQGVVFEKAVSVRIDGESFGVMRVIGVTHDELEFARSFGVDLLIAKLRRARLYPCTRLQRQSVV
jgi:Suppressor of fused protein (SUFU)